MTAPREGLERGAVSEKKRMRRAQLLAEAVAVLCPWCGEPQPNNDGSEMWTREDFKEGCIGPRPCVACDEVMSVSFESKAQFQ